MASDRLAKRLTSAACFFAAGVLVAWPLVVAGRVNVASVVLAAPFIFAGLSPRGLGPSIGKGVMIVGTLLAFYDPPSSIGFFPGRFLVALPLFAIGLLLGVPMISEAIARKALGERIV